MFRSYLGSTSLVRTGLYAIGVVFLSLGVAWGAATVGVAYLRLLDAKILDRSGVAPPEEDWTPPSTASPTDPNTPDAQLPPLGASPQPSVSSLPRTAPEASTDDPVHDPAAQFHNGATETYRTYCVRLCDGYYWPISFSTTPDRFDIDAESCNRACGSPARLFVHRIPGGGPGTMVSAEGLPYRSLKTAFLFRTKYDAQCKCQPQPWEEASKDRHRYFAAAEAARKGDVVAAATAKALARKIDTARRLEAEAKAGAEIQASRELAALARKNDLVAPSRTVGWRYADAIQQSALLKMDPDHAEGRKGRFIPASGSGRAWKERVFGDN